MSTTKHREKMPNYLLQWEAMRSAAGKGCEVYDLWGAPDRFDETDPMYGVYRFKDGLGGEVVRTIGAWDFPNNRLLYFLYQIVLPKLLSITRKNRRKQIKQEVS
jgi:peptidoglycan pentaglycine glycine transferase (the first glycine)